MKLRIVLISHDKKKNEIIALSKMYREILAEHQLYGTGTTGTMIIGETGLSIHRLKSGKSAFPYLRGCLTTLATSEYASSSRDGRLTPPRLRCGKLKPR